MSVKYRKWRELSIEPSNIKFKHIKLISIVSYPPAQNDVVESIVVTLEAAGFSDKMIGEDDDEFVRSILGI